jgi:hypothetical protein
VQAWRGDLVAYKWEEFFKARRVWGTGPGD